MTRASHIVSSKRHQNAEHKALSPPTASKLDSHIRDDDESSSDSLLDNSSAPNSRIGTPSPQDGDPEAIPEDSVTCEWDDCGIVFTHLPTLIDHIHNDHIGVHKSSYTCEWATCQRRALPQTSRFALISHIRSHTGEKPFTCPKPECDKSFTRSDALAKHMRLQHNIEPPAPGRGGNRKRKRGVEEPSASSGSAPGPTGMQASSSTAGGQSGFSTFKVQPHTYSKVIAELTNIDQREKDHQNGSGQPNGRLRRSPSPFQGIPPLAFDLPRPQHHDDDDDDKDPVELLPEYLAKQLDPKTGLVCGKTPAMVMYLLMKAKHRYALEKHDMLTEELERYQSELLDMRKQKEEALSEVIKVYFGHQADHLIPTPEQHLPLSKHSDLEDDIFPSSGAPERNYSQHPTSIPSYLNGHGR